MFDGQLNKFCREVNREVADKGFWTAKRTAACNEEYYVHGINKDIQDAFISQKIALIMSECGEALEAMRKGNYGEESKDTFEDEIADVFIRLADLCGEMNIDIEKQITWKRRYNNSRPSKHGKGF